MLFRSINDIIITTAIIPISPVFGDEPSAAGFSASGAAGWLLSVLPGVTTVLAASSYTIAYVENLSVLNVIKPVSSSNTQFSLSITVTSPSWTLITLYVLVLESSLLISSSGTWTFNVISELNSALTAALLPTCFSIVISNTFPTTPLLTSEDIFVSISSLSPALTSSFTTILNLISAPA